MRRTEQQNPGQFSVWSPAVAVVMVLAVGACAQRPVSPQSTPRLDCKELLEAFDAKVAEAEVGWSGAGRVRGFPHLRIDRFLASYREAPLSDAAIATWTQRMGELDRRGRRHELARLPAASHQTLSQSREDLGSRMEHCAEQMRVADLERPERTRALRRAAVVADDYSLAQRTFGLYPLTFMPVSEGVYRLQKTIREDFTQGPDNLPQLGHLTRYVPPGEAAVDGLPVAERYDPLGIPLLTGIELEALFAGHAPVWEVDTGGPFDKPGVPFWQSPASPAVRYDTPVSYRYHSWTRWNQQVLLQLNYLIWFDQRPPRSSNDLLSGRLDGVHWRVTLRVDGRPLLYDSMHACGCYHMFFPAPDLTVRARLRRAPEPPLVPAPAPSWVDNSRIVLRLASGSHYLQAVYRDSASTGQRYSFRDYSELYEIAGPDGRPLGLFSPDGLVAGSERAERWVLWPMGVVSPGAMRGRGRHATAFVGRRHFDDPDLIETVFDSVPVVDSPI